MNTEFPWWTDAQRTLAGEARRLASTLALRSLAVYASRELPRDALSEIARHRYFGTVIPKKHGGSAPMFELRL